MIRVLVVDDHPVVRGGLVGWLAAHRTSTVVGEAGDGRRLSRWSRRLRAGRRTDGPADASDGRRDGDGAARGRATRPSRVLVLTTYDTDTDIVRAVEAGATGYLLKDTPLPELADAVRSAARGETVLAPPVAARLVSRLRAPAGRCAHRRPRARGARRRGSWAHQRGDRPGAVHRRGDGEDASAAGVREARCRRPDASRAGRGGAGTAALSRSLMPGCQGLRVICGQGSDLGIHAADASSSR